MSDVVTSEGYFTGVLDLFFAEMKQEETSASPPVYGDPEVLAKSIEVTITPVYKEGTLNASNATVRKVKFIDQYNAKMNADKIPYAKMGRIMGRKKDADGVQYVSGDNRPRYYAVGFACTLDDGSREYWWLYKGTFAEIAKTAKTEGEKIEYQTPTVEASFVRRMDTNNLAAIADSGDKTIAPSVFGNWFKQVRVQATTPAGDQQTQDPDEEESA